MPRIWLAALLLVTSFVGVVASAPQAAAADAPTYIFESNPMQIGSGNLQLLLDVVDPPDRPARLSITISEIGDPAGPARALRTVTYSHATRFEADPQFKEVRLHPSAAQMGDHGAIDMTFVSEGRGTYCGARSGVGDLVGRLRFDATLGPRTFHVDMDRVRGLMHTDSCTRIECQHHDSTRIRGTNEPGHTHVQASVVEYGDGPRHTLDAWRNWSRTTSGWGTRLAVAAVLPAGSITLDDDQQHGSVRGHPGTFVRHASTFTADRPTKHLDEVACEGRAGRFYRANTSRAVGSLTPGTDAGSLEIRWINGRTSRWTSDHAIASHTAVRRTSS